MQEKRLRSGPVAATAGCAHGHAGTGRIIVSLKLFILDPDPLSCILSLLCAAQPTTHAIEFSVPNASCIAAIVVALIGLALSAFNSGSELAYFSLTRDDVNSIANESKRHQVARLLSNPERLLATILIGNNLVNVMIVVVLNYAMNYMFTFNSPVANFLVQTVILTFLILLFGEVLPKLYASNANVRFATFAATPLQLACTLLSPVSRLMVKSTFIVNKVVTKRADNISMDDLSKALEASDVKNADEKDILEGILKFGDKTVAEIMRPRVDVVDVDYDSTFNEVLKTVIDNGYSRMPVYEHNHDNIKGVLYAKDLLPYIDGRPEGFRWQQLVRPAHFVPETRMIDDLLEDFRTKKRHMAIVVDEYGCTQGIATLEDVLEEIVGEIDDEYDTEEKFYSKVGKNTYIFNGKAQLGDFFEVTGLDEREFASATDDAETLAGLLLNIKGDFLEEKETLTWGRCEFQVLKVKRHRIAKVRVQVKPAPPTDKK